MIKAIIFDFSRVILLTKDQFQVGSLNTLHQQQKEDLNVELLDYLRKIKDQVELYIFTTGSIQDEPEIKQQLEPIFKKIYTTLEIGLPKTNPRSFKELANRIQKKPAEILFIDDSLANVQSAQQAGLQATQYTNNDKLWEKLKQLK